jgi:alanine racemase
VIHRNALQHNLALVKAKAPNARVMAVIKANGYGHGLLAAAAGLSGADGFAVLGIDEASRLRAEGYQQPIFLLEGTFVAEELNACVRLDLRPTIHTQLQLNHLLAAKLIEPLHIQLKMNSGMNRLGFEPHHFQEAYDALSQSRNVATITLMTHFATADEPVGIGEPLAVFERVTRDISGQRTLANSATILANPEAHGDWVRPGIILYGASPFADRSAEQLGLKPAMTLQSELISIQRLEVGQGVGYGQTFVASHAMRVGTVACGYADGYPRHAPTGTPIAVDGIMTRTLGRVSMDMLCVDLDPIPLAHIGSRVELWGEQVPVDVVATAAGTIGYELLCALAPRVPVLAE